jgi:hypothetical protein
VRVTHKPRNAEGKPTFGGADMSLRGKLVGGGRRCAGAATTTCSSPTGQSRQGVRQARERLEDAIPHAMMVKVAEAMALRKAFSIAGVIGEGEVSGVRSVTRRRGGRPRTRFHWPEDEELAEELQAGFRIARLPPREGSALVNACEDDREGSRAARRACTRRPMTPSPITDAEVVA